MSDAELKIATLKIVLFLIGLWLYILLLCFFPTFIINFSFHIHRWLITDSYSFQSGDGSTTRVILEQECQKCGAMRHRHSDSEKWLMGPHPQTLRKITAS